MVELRLLSGNTDTADCAYLVRRFPCTIGRSSHADLRLEHAGVWDRHLNIELAPEGFIVVSLPEAHTALNGQPVERASLRNGDIIDAGAAKLQFWLAEPTQRSLRFREMSTWIGLGFLCVVEVVVVYLLVR